jgi:SAM-dependent methyltransferase
VEALSRNGYQAIGVDYEPHAVQTAQEIFPDQDIRLGNVLDLEFPDHYFDCYLSIGVIEHFIDGPEQALIEARRVLKSDGTALISVPYLNPPRKKLQRKMINLPPQADLNFHQYYFSINEFSDLLLRANLKPVATYPYAVEAFLIREHPIFSSFWNSIFCRERVKSYFRLRFKNAAIRLRKCYGHMLLYICQP